MNSVLCSSKSKQSRTLNTGILVPQKKMIKSSSNYINVNPKCNKSNVFDEVEVSTMATDDSADSTNAVVGGMDFEKFIHELFEHTGVINDLRSYLRSHIINIINSCKSGKMPNCQKNFMQRLEPKCQAVNLLILEYLIQSDFAYTLSVYVSELPLTNMEFSFTDKLMKANENFEITSLKFSANDVLNLLQDLGYPKDSAAIFKILDIYKKEQKKPLLLCIFDQFIGDVNANKNSKTDKMFDFSSLNSSDANNTKKKISTQKRKPNINEMKQMFRNKKRQFEQWSNTNKWNVRSILSNVGDVERNTIEEMFEQLRSVYEREIELVKAEEKRRIEYILKSQSLMLKKRTSEMEKSYEQRELELQTEMKEKKSFLWKMANSLKEQHDEMARAMETVRIEEKRISMKEQSLKRQLQEAEFTLKSRAANMKKQISEELQILEKQLNNIKEEKDELFKERVELEKLKSKSKSSEVIDMLEENVGIVSVLREKNSELSELVKMQKLEIEALKSQQASLQKQLDQVTAPSTGDKLQPFYISMQNMNSQPTRAGGGEELKVFGNDRSALNNPSEDDPFLAVEKNKNKRAQRLKIPRTRSPNTILREAKMRLRKLEIESDVVHRSYNEVKKKEAPSFSSLHPVCFKKQMKKSDNMDEIITKANNDIEIIISKSGVNKDNNMKRTASNNKNKIENYIDKPIKEFRKLYEKDFSKNNNVVTQNTIDELASEVSMKFIQSHMISKDSEPSSDESKSSLKSRISIKIVAENSEVVKQNKADLNEPESSNIDIKETDKIIEENDDFVKKVLNEIDTVNKTKIKHALNTFDSNDDNSPEKLEKDITPINSDNDADSIKSHEFVSKNKEKEINNNIETKTEIILDSPLSKEYSDDFSVENTSITSSISVARSNYGEKNDFWD